MATPRQYCTNISRSLLHCLIAAAGIALLALGAHALRAQDSPASLDRDAILHHLNAVITWYRDSTTKIKSVGLPSDAIYQDNAETSPPKLSAWHFSPREPKRVSSPQRARPPAPLPDPRRTAQPTQQQNLSQTAAKIAAQIDDAQTKLDAVNKQLATAPRSQAEGSDGSTRPPPGTSHARQSAPGHHSKDGLFRRRRSRRRRGPAKAASTNSPTPSPK